MHSLFHLGHLPGGALFASLFSGDVLVCRIEGGVSGGTHDPNPGKSV